MSDPAPRREVQDSKGRIAIDHPGGGTSELTYSILSPHIVIADHTEVAAGQEGKGVGLRLLTALLDDARDQGFKVVPLCPFVNAQRRKHPQWADLFHV